VHTDDYTGYVSPYFVISKGKFTKQYFEGAGRIVSKLGNGSFAQPLKLTAGGVNYGKLTTEQQKALDNYVRGLGVPPGPPTQQGIYATPEFTGDPYPSDALKPVEENQEPPEGWPRNPVFNAPGDVPGPPVQFGPPVEPETVKAGEGFTGIGLPENDIFYFHPDHLGSTSYITSRNGSIWQHVEYIAFGEVLFEEHSSSFSSPYLFNGKELDRETNLSYYGARYLDMKTSLWLNVDPLATYNPIFEEEFYFDGDHNDGIYNSKNLNGYGYCYQNPISLIDPNGKQCYFMTPPTERISGTQASMSIDFVPVVGDAKGLIEAIIGYDFAGNKLSGNDRFLSVLLMSELKDAKNTIKVIKEVSKVERASVKVVNEVKRLNAARSKAVRDAWKQEKALIESGAEGTRNWTRKELKELKETGKVKGYKGHHINNVKDHPDMAGDPNNIEFLTHSEHYIKHNNGKYKEKTTGDLVSRKVE
jgi:RHS repeat-associated protein